MYPVSICHRPVHNTGSAFRQPRTERRGQRNRQDDAHTAGKPLHNLNAYKIALQAPNQKIKIIIRRDGEMREFEFKVRSIK